MCGLAEASLAATAIGTATSVYGRLQEGRAVKKQAAYQAAVARNNAILAERAAQDAEQRGQLEAQRLALQSRQLSGRQRAALAANGVLVDTGIALDVVEDTAAMGKLDQLTARRNAGREAANYRAQGMNFEASAQLAEARGASARRASYLEGLSTFSTGAGSVADKWYRFNREGAFD